MPQNYTSLRFQLNPKEDPHFQRFQKELLKSSGRTALLTDTTIEQLNSFRPDGTPIFTGYQSRGYYKNDGSIPDYPNVPLATLNIKSRMENEATKEKTIAEQKMKELDLIKEQNRPKPTQSTFKQFFRNDTNK